MLSMEEKLLDLFGRLSRASARSKLCALRAQKDKRPALAKLFLALAESQARQAQRFLMQIRGRVGPSDENEHLVFSEEIPKAIDEYAELLQEAEQLGSKALATGFRHSGNVDKIILSRHKQLNEEGEEPEYFVCDFCGYVAVDEPPDHCPICTAPKNRFLTIDGS